LRGLEAAPRQGRVVVHARHGSRRLSSARQTVSAAMRCASDPRSNPICAATDAPGPNRPSVTDVTPGESAGARRADGGRIASLSKANPVKAGDAKSSV
jgi:hypothetical protein